jgi:hypothetical protein
MSDESNKKNAHDNLVHAGEFTKIENTAIVYVLRGWFAGVAGVPGALEAGDDAWANTTLFEHFVGKLNADAKTRTKESRAVYAELNKRAEASQERLNTILGADNEEDERINELTDKAVQEVLHKLGL